MQNAKNRRPHFAPMPKSVGASSPAPPARRCARRARRSSGRWSAPPPSAWRSCRRPSPPSPRSRPRAPPCPPPPSPPSPRRRPCRPAARRVHALALGGLLGLLRGGGRLLRLDLRGRRLERLALRADRLRLRRLLHLKVVEQVGHDHRAAREDEVVGGDGGARRLLHLHLLHHRRRRGEEPEGGGDEHHISDRDDHRSGNLQQLQRAPFKRPLRRSGVVAGSSSWTSTFRMLYFERDPRSHAHWPKQ